MDKESVEQDMANYGLLFIIHYVTLINVIRVAKPEQFLILEYYIVLCSEPLSNSALSEPL